ncbi:MAG: site-2 protease family protein [Myxococcota bacterium]
MTDHDGKSELTGPTAPLEPDPWESSSSVEIAPEPLSALIGEAPPVPKAPERSPQQPPPARSFEPPRLRVALALFVLTCVTTTAVHLTLTHQPGGLRELMLMVYEKPKLLRPALIYALALMGILLVHDLGHSLAAIRNKVQQSYPYFIPFPSVIGTLGSIVFLRAPPKTRGTLLRVGASGPLIGMAVAIPVTAYGLTLSAPLNMDEVPGGSTWLGNSLLFTALAEFFSPNGIEVQLHPLAFAGWVAMFVTSLNLIPASQLDGGHISYALFGKKAWILAITVVIGLLAYGLFLTFDGTYGAYAGAPWLIWGTLLFVLGTGHPPVRDPQLPLKATEIMAALCAVALLVATFVPVPVQIVPDNPGEAEFLEQEDEPEQDWSVDGEDDPESFDL